MKAVEEYIHKYFGRVENVFHETKSTGIHVDVCVIPPSEENHCYTLATMGMGARKMNVPKELVEYRLERAELAISLPSDWKLDKESLNDMRWYWPIKLLLSTARMPIRDKTWLGCGHTVRNDKGAAYANNTKLSGCILIDPPTFGGDRVIGYLPGGDPVNFYQIIPLYEKELDYDIRYGFDALMTRLSNAVSYVVDPARPSALA